MLTAGSVEEILRVIKKTKEYYVGGESVGKAYILACRLVSKNRKFYQTVADGCTRRLGFVGRGATAAFQRVLREWIDGDGNNLKKILLTKADKTASGMILAFFDEKAASSGIKETKVGANTSQDTEIISFRLPVSLVQQLKVLAEARGQSPVEWVSKTVIAAIDAELHDLLSKMIKNMPDENRQKFLKELQKQ